MLSERYYSHGKLLITGEYVVLDGATAFALPTRYGQDLVVTAGTDHTIEWQSFDADGSIWFEAVIAFSQIRGNSEVVSDGATAVLLTLLQTAYALNPDFLERSEGYRVATHLSFPRNWGLGTSSTLISNVAQWTKSDPYLLLERSFGGSGYDIACALHEGPLLYRLESGTPIVSAIAFNPDFASNLYFVYLNKKQNSRSAIGYYKKTGRSTTALIEQLDNITNRVVNAPDLDAFILALEQHETIMGTILCTDPVRQLLFADFEGAVKSLGAWGGDFVLVASHSDPTAYFSAKGYTTLIPYHLMVK